MLCLCGGDCHRAGRDRHLPMLRACRPIWSRSPASPARAPPKPRPRTCWRSIPAMFELYGDAAKVFRANILAKHPVILGLFSGAGGRFILYRPGMAPLEAPSVPMVYQLLKSVGHSTMALVQVVGPYVDNAENQSWRGSMQAYRSRMQSALDGLDATADAGGVARQQPHHPAEQHRVHGRLPGQGRDHVRRTGGVLQEAGTVPGEGRDVGGTDPGRRTG